MDTIELGTWEEFESAIEQLMVERKAKKRGEVWSNLLFRGQSDSEWGLTTTLERYVKGDFPLTKYYWIISVLTHEIETFTGIKWPLPKDAAFVDWVADAKKYFDISGNIPEYEYMAYLRHHGFPSPLLDWTRSPFIAAFFAFNSFPLKTEKVSIFVYQEYVSKGKVHRINEPYIAGLGPHITSHKRHFLQKTEYTICVIHEDKDIFYTGHERVFSVGEEHQDKLIKYILPTSEGKKILKLFDKYNLNEFSLFGTEDSLMSSLSMREFYLDI